MLGLDISRKQLGDDCNLKGIMSHLYIHFETIVARSSRTRSSNVARGSNVFYLTNQKIMSHIRIHFGTIVARGSRTRSSNVAFGP